MIRINFTSFYTIIGVHFYLTVKRVKIPRVFSSYGIVCYTDMNIIISSINLTSHSRIVAELKTVGGFSSALIFPRSGKYKSMRAFFKCIPRERMISSCIEISVCAEGSLNSRLAHPFFETSRSTFPSAFLSVSWKKRLRNGEYVNNEITKKWRNLPASRQKGVCDGIVRGKHTRTQKNCTKYARHMQFFT